MPLVKTLLSQNKNLLLRLLTLYGNVRAWSRNAHSRWSKMSKSFLEYCPSNNPIHVNTWNFDCLQKWNFQILRRYAMRFSERDTQQTHKSQKFAVRGQIILFYQNLYKIQLFCLRKFSEIKERSLSDLTCHFTSIWD